MGFRKGLLSKKINAHIIITLKEINQLSVDLGIDTLDKLKQVYPAPTKYQYGRQYTRRAKNRRIELYW